MRSAHFLAAIPCIAALAATPLSWSQGAPPPPGRVVALVTNLRNDAGVVRVGLYNDPARWPRSGQNSRHCESTVHGRRATCEIGDLPPGTYALAITHDENNNGHFDTGFLGWPLEGYGFSNNAHPHMLGPPSWESARFVYVGVQPMTVAMAMQY